MQPLPRFLRSFGSILEAPQESRHFNRIAPNSRVRTAVRFLYWMDLITGLEMEKKSQWRDGGWRVWFVIGGRWSGDLSRYTWGREITNQMIALEREHGVQVWSADGDVSESLRTCIWEPLGLLTTVKPPALRERHDLQSFRKAQSLAM